MTDLMQWMYQNYIKPQIESQPKDFGKTALFDMFHNELDSQMQQNLQEALAYYAAQSSRLGVRTRVALGADLN